MARRPALPGLDRRSQILEAALDVFAEEGFEGATTKEIAARADVTQGLIYFYFPSKDDLFLAAFSHQAEQVFARLDVPLREDEEPPEVVLPRAIARFVEAFDSPSGSRLLRIMMRVSAHHSGGASPGTPLEAVRCRIRAQGQRMGSLLAPYLDAQIARGMLRPVNTALVAHCVASSVMFAMMRRAAGDDGLATLTREEVVATIVTLFLHGLLPEHGAAAAAPFATVATLEAGVAATHARGSDQANH